MQDNAAVLLNAGSVDAEIDDPSEPPAYGVSPPARTVQVSLQLVRPAHVAGDIRRKRVADRGNPKLAVRLLYGVFLIGPMGVAISSPVAEPWIAQLSLDVGGVAVAGIAIRDPGASPAFGRGGLRREHL